MPIYYTIPLFCALVYCIGSLMIKRATLYGVGVMRVLFLSNWALLALTLPSLADGFYVQDWSLWWAPVVASLLNFFAGLLLMLAIRFGDLSVQTPLMGTKVLFVATFSMFIFGHPVPLSWWIGAFITLIAVFLVSFSRFRQTRAAYISIVFTLSAAIIFSIRDLFVVEYVEQFGRDAFFLCTFALLAMESLFLVPFFRAELWSTPPKAWKWLLLGSGLLAIQQYGLLKTLAAYDHATPVNIMYSSRGFWSVLIAWVLAHWFKGAEQHVTRPMFIRRLSGAILMCIAIVIVLTD